MILTLAYRNLFHDRIRLAVTLVGILFSIVLVAVQLGLLFGATRMIVGMIDESKSDLWIMIYGAKSFDEGGVLMTPRERHQALASPEVKAVIPLVVSFAEWRKPGGGSGTIIVVGTEPEYGGLEPWGLVQGDWQDIKAPDGVSADQTYLAELGIDGIGDHAQIATGRVHIRALTRGLRSFTQSPYIYTTLTRARSLLGVDGEKSSFFLVQLRPGADVEAARKGLQGRLEGADVLTKAEFRSRSLDQWLYRTGAGVALIGGAILGVMVGTVIVAQTLYSSTKDHLKEFATLRALGASSGYIHKVILAQASISGVIGYLLGMSIALGVVHLSQGSALPLVMSPPVAAVLFGVTLVMCTISAISAIIKVTKIDPATVFNR